MGYPKRKFKKVSGAHIGARAKPVYACEACGWQSVPGHPKPKACPGAGCTSLVFKRFASIGESGRWWQLRLLEAQGHISDLQCQVRIDLMAARQLEGRTVAAKVGQYIADFTYRKDGQFVIEDFKSAGVMDPLASWKLRHVEQQFGQPVKITT